MKYKAEVVKENKVIESFYFKNATHPNQAVRKIAKELKGVFEFYNIFVMNEAGEVWVYAITDNQHGFEAKNIKKTGVVYNRDEVHMIFSGNKTIKG